MTKSNYYEFIANVLLSVALSGSCIGFLYFTVSCQIERTIAQDNVYRLTDDFTGDLNIILGPDFVNANRNAIEQGLTIQKSQSLIDADNQVLAQNAALYSKAKKVLLSMIVIGVIGYSGLYMLAKKAKKPWNVKHSLLVNVGLTGVIALTEVTFLLTIAKNYYSATPQYVKKTVVDNIRSYGNS